MKRLDQLLRESRCQPVPKGWLSRDEFAKAEGYTNSAGGFYYTLRQAVTAGLVESREFRVPLAKGTRMIAHYRRTKAAH